MTCSEPSNSINGRINGATLTVSEDASTKDAAKLLLAGQGADAIHGAPVFLAPHARGTALTGEPPKEWIGILRYPFLDDALAFDSSPE
jgi:hypothetical protein